MENKTQHGEQHKHKDTNTKHQPGEKHDRRPLPKSTFNDSEYRRWSEHLRRSRDTKGK